MPATSAGFVLRGDATPLRELLRSLWASRSLLRMLARKDFFVRYRRASLGMVWAVGLPAVQAAVVGVVFSRVVRIDTEVNYGAFVFAGLLPWTFFSNTVTSGATSIVDGQALATKIYFPRAVLPLVSVWSGLYGFLPGVAVLVVMAAVVGADLGPELLLLVPAVLLIVAMTAALSLVLSALHVYFRDVRHALQAVMRAWFYATPVLYPLEAAPDGMRPFLEANPATAVVELFRAATVGASEGWARSLGWAAGWLVASLIVAGFLHCRSDRAFTDLL